MTRRAGPTAAPATALALAAVLSGCTVGPNYHRPAVAVPPAYRNAAPGEPSTAASLGDQKWTAVFEDPVLDGLIRTALGQSYDVRIAASRVLQAQAQVGLARADQFPSISGSAGFTSERVAGFGALFNLIELQGLLSWTPDFWGQYRRATEAARANLLAADWNRRQVLVTVVANVSMAYFQLRELDQELAISQQALADRQESLRLTQTLANGGAATLLDVRQAQQLVETAAAAIPDTQRQILQQEDLLSTLLGENPHGIPRGRPLAEQPAPAALPVGIPSRLLERRPDIRAAEQQLIAANAEIGVARSQFFPSLPLTAVGGLASPSLAGLLRSSAPEWTITAPITQPIFTAGRLRSNLKLAEAQEQQALLTYQQTIQQAFRQVSDALAAYHGYREFRIHQEALTAAAQDAVRLANLLYRGGATSYLEVLTGQANYYAAQLNLARAGVNERLSLVQVYQALGGGWEP
ncbi:MAG TPA: efflux transporter outer membrane subunit [Bryobacteraceae bacterium]|nr:efflux transporter outer membrane subunit [Bryobacteraceae bacterium]